MGIIVTISGGNNFGDLNISLFGTLKKMNSVRDQQLINWVGSDLDCLISDDSLWTQTEETECLLFFISVSKLVGLYFVSNLKYRCI